MLENSNGIEVVLMLGPNILKREYKFLVATVAMNNLHAES